MAKYICAECQVPIKRGHGRRRYGTTPAHQDQYFMVHVDRDYCNAVIAARKTTRRQTEAK